MKREEVFLAYNSKDREIVEPIYNFLEGKKLRCWIDFKSLTPGDDSIEEIQKGMDAARSAVIFVGKTGLGAFQGGIEVKFIISLLAEKDKDFRIITVLLPGVAEPPKELRIIHFRHRVSLSKANDYDALESIYRGVSKGQSTTVNKLDNDSLLDASSLSTAKKPQARILSSGTSSVTTLNVLIDQIKTGRVLLFVGSKFCESSKNRSNQTLPNHKALAREICELANVDEDEDLDYATEYFLSKFEPDTLVKHLRQRFLVSTVAEPIHGILEPTWLRIYTPNYDNTLEHIERSLHGETLAVSSAWTQPDQNSIKNIQCVHINGSIEQLEKEDLQQSFRLSDSSFSSSNFKDSYWYSTFKKDLDRCSAVIFVGCHFEEFKPIKAHFENELYKNKSFFLLDKDISEKNKFSFERYGSIILENVKDFAQQMPSRVGPENHRDYSVSSFAFHELTEEESDISDRDVWDFLIYGKLKQVHFEQAISAPQLKPYMVERDCISDIVEDLSKFNTVVVHSEFGNGKTVLLNQIASHLALLGRKVFKIFDHEADYLLDIENIVRRYENPVFIVDDYTNYKDVVEALLQRKHEAYFSLLLSERSGSHDYTRIKLFGESPTVREYDIDILSEKECQFFIDILNTTGIWEAKQGFSDMRKMQIVQTDYKRKFSLALLGLLDSEQIKARIHEIVQPLFSNPETKSTIFSICILGLMNLPIKTSLISEISQNDHIYKDSLTGGDSFRQLFGNYQSQAIEKQSSIIMVHLLHSHFSPTYCISKLIEIAEHFYESQRYDEVSKDIYKNLMRFSFVEKLLPDTNKKSSLNTYYQDVKTRIPKLSDDVHYWLHYAMAKMMFKDIRMADTYLKNAYSIAARRKDFSTIQLDTQQARLYLMKADTVRPQSGQPTNHNFDPYELFLQAHRLLKPLESNVHKFRQVIAYEDVFNHAFDSFTRKQKVEFEHSCKDMLKRLKNDAPDYNHSVIRECGAALERTLRKIGAERAKKI